MLYDDLTIQKYKKKLINIKNCFIVFVVYKTYQSSNVLICF